tara:strand:+ start:1076 stop:1273 length:198 start_codon:yes stop_codon:yes gene_type:complete
MAAAKNLISFNPKFFSSRFMCLVFGKSGTGIVGDFCFFAPRSWGAASFVFRSHPHKRYLNRFSDV